MTEYPDIQFRKYEQNPAKHNWFEVTTDCQFETCLSDQKLVIPQGYTTDFASVPRWLWPIFPPHGRMANAAVVHDFCYDNKIGEEKYGTDRARLIADIEFGWNCRRSGVPKIQMCIVLAFIRIFGKSWWIN